MRYNLYKNGRLVGWHKGEIGLLAFDNGQCSASLRGETGTVITTVKFDEERYEEDAEDFGFREDTFEAERPTPQDFYEIMCLRHYPLKEARRRIEKYRKGNKHHG